MSADPQFTSTPRHACVQVSTTADTSRTNPTTSAVNLFTAGANGSRIEELDIVAYGTTVAGVLCFFIYDGTTFHDFLEVAIPVVTPSATVPVYRRAFTFENLVLKSNEYLRVTSQVANQYAKVHAFGGDF